MKKVVLTLLCLCLLAGNHLYAQTDKPKENAKPNAADLVDEWFRRLNALDGTEESVNRFVELYQPDAFQQVGPGEKQFGPVFFQDQRQIRKWAEDFAKGHAPIPEAVYFQVRLQTVNEKTTQLVYSVETPWGDLGASAEFTGRYVDPRNNKGFMVNGAAFFQWREGKIARLRLYMPREEIMEVTPPLRP